MSSSVAAPLDVKLMNMTATVLFLGLLAIGAVATVRWVVRMPAFDIKGIVVTGDVSHNNALTLRANVTPRLAGSFFSIDLARVRAAFEAVPWVRHAVVRRDFPSRLMVTLQEHQAVAYWGSESEPRLINSFGEVFEANVDEVEQDTLPRLNGPEGQAADVLAMYHVLAPYLRNWSCRWKHWICPVAVAGVWSWRVAPTLRWGAAVWLKSPRACGVFSRRSHR